MKKLSLSLLIATAVLALVNCGKKKEDDAPAAAPVALSKLAITCGGLACVGTEGK